MRSPQQHHNRRWPSRCSATTTRGQRPPGGPDVSESADYRASRARNRLGSRSCPWRLRERGMCTVLVRVAGMQPQRRHLASPAPGGEWRPLVILRRPPLKRNAKYHYLWRFWRDPPSRAGRHFRPHLVRLSSREAGGLCDSRRNGSALRRSATGVPDGGARAHTSAKFWMHISPRNNSPAPAREDTPHKEAQDHRGATYRKLGAVDEYVMAVDQKILHDF